MDKSPKGNVILKIGQYADRVETAIASVAFVFMCIFVLTTVVYRYVLHEPILWSEEASRYLMITGIFIAMPVAIRNHVHLGVDLFINMLPKSLQKAAHIFSDVITLVAYLAIDYACYLFVAKTMNGNQSSPAMHIPMIVIYSVIFIGFILATVAQISNMVAEYTGIQSWDGEERVEQ